MKYRLALLLFLCPILAGAQEASINAQAMRVVAELRDSWTLGVDSNSATVDIAMFNKYKSLFDLNARVDDDLNFQLVPGTTSGAYRVFDTAKDFDVYAHDAALQVSKFRIDSTTTQLMGRRGDSIIYEIRRTIYVEKPARYVLQDIDALAAQILANHPGIGFEKRGRTAKTSNESNIIDRLKSELTKSPDSVYKFHSVSTLRVILMRADDTLNPVKIVRIRHIGSVVSCLNDDDADGILNDADSLRKKYGDFTARGTPDDDLDGVPDTYDRCRGTYGAVHNKGCPESYFVTNKQFEGTIGFQFNTFQIGLPELNQLAYQIGGANAVDILQSTKGSLKSSSPASGIYAGGGVSYFFGNRAKRVGLSAGVFYSRFVASYELDDAIRYTYKAQDQNGDFYRRQILIDSLSEKMALNVVNIPVQLSYRFKLDGNSSWVFNIKAGPSLMLIDGLTDYKSTIDVGGIYQFDANDRITYTDHFDSTSTRNVYFTTFHINKQSPIPGAAAIFSQLDSIGYDFASYKSFRDQKKTSRTTVAINLSIDGQYRKSKNNPLSVKAGVHLTYAPSVAGREKYKPIDKTTDEYNSIFNSNGSSYYLAYGINIGLVYDF
jgi:hypothetical protein